MAQPSAVQTVRPTEVKLGVLPPGDTGTAGVCSNPASVASRATLTFVLATRAAAADRRAAADGRGAAGQCAWRRAHSWSPSGRPAPRACRWGPRREERRSRGASGQWRPISSTGGSGAAAGDEPAALLAARHVTRYLYVSERRQADVAPRVATAPAESAGAPQHSPASERNSQTDNSPNPTNSLMSSSTVTLHPRVLERYTSSPATESMHDRNIALFSESYQG